MSSNNNTRTTRRTTRKQAGPAEVAGSALSTSASVRGQAGSGLKLQLRCIQSALHPVAATSSSHSTAGSAGFARSASAGPSAGQKRAAEQIYDDDDDTDSDIEIYASVRLQKKTARLQAKRKSTAAGPSGRGSKKQKPNPVSRSDVEQSSGDEEESIFLVQPDLKRTRRMLDINNPEHARLVANATKVGNDYYDSDAEEPADKGKGKAKAQMASQPGLFRNVSWGSAASDYSNDADFPTRPAFTQFVPGRFELLPDGSVDDQKRKLIIKFTDKNGRKRIFANPPPVDWSNQKAITALNKRSAQQIRRNTSVRFREVVQAYLPAERQWILRHLDTGKPTNGWKQFVEDFNARFQGRVVRGATDLRPARSHASLTKEVERFGTHYYSKGLVPVVTQLAKARM